MHKVGKNRKCTEWPQTELEDLTGKSIIYTLHTYPRGPNFGPFRSTTSCFRDTRSSKIGNAPSDHKLNLDEHLTVKILYMHILYLPQGAQTLVHFALRLAVSEIHVQGGQKSEMHRMTPNWTWTLNSQKYSTGIHWILNPEAQILVHFALFRDTKCTRWANIGNALNDA